MQNGQEMKDVIHNDRKLACKQNTKECIMHIFVEYYVYWTYIMHNVKVLWKPKYVKSIMHNGQIVDDPKMRPLCMIDSQFVETHPGGVVPSMERKMANILLVPESGA